MQNALSLVDKFYQLLRAKICRALEQILLLNYYYSYKID